MLTRIISVLIIIGMGEWGWCEDIPTYSFNDKGNIVEHRDIVKAPEPLKDEPVVGRVVDDRQMTHPYYYPGYYYPVNGSQMVHMHATTYPGAVASASTVTMDYGWNRRDS